MPIRRGFVFGGWDADVNYITDNITVRATWLRLGALSTSGTGSVTSADATWLARHLMYHPGFDLSDIRIADINKLCAHCGSNDL